MNNLAIDIDGVLANTDFWIHWWHYVNNKKIINYNFRYSGKTYEMEKHYNPKALSTEELHGIFNNKEFWETIPAFWGSQVFLKELKKYYKIHLLTNRRWIPELPEITKTWLSVNKITYDELHFLKPEEKVQFCKDYHCESIVEDHPYTIEQCSKFMNVCAVRYMHNEHLGQKKNVYLCNSYYDIVCLLSPGEIDDHTKYSYKHSGAPLCRDRPRGWRGRFYRFMWANKDSIINLPHSNIDKYVKNN